MNFDIREQTPLVSVSVITYNHAEHIRECLDSLLMQETSFPYEICLGEDASSDGTREICVEYAEKHPECIRLILRSQSDSGRDAYVAQGNYNYVQTTKECTGKYLAICEGDDAWTDPLKLQKQYDIMEADSGVSLIHSDFDKMDLVSGRRTSFVHRENGQAHAVNPDRSLFMYDVLQAHYPITTCTTFMRMADVHDILDKHIDLFQKLPMGDIPVWCLLIDYGYFVYMDESLAIYRVLEESASNTQSPVRKYAFVNKASDLGLMLGRDHALPMDLIRLNKIKNCNRYTLLSGDCSELRKLYANKDFHFSFMETLIYWACRITPLREIAKKAFLIRYNRNDKAIHLSGSVLEE